MTGKRKRISIVAAFALLTASFVLGLAAITQVLAVRGDQIRKLHDVDVKSCTRQHGLDGVVQGILARQIKLIDTQKIPDLTVAQQTKLDEINAVTRGNLQDGLSKARKVDCHAVPPLPKKKPATPVVAPVG